MSGSEKHGDAVEERESEKILQDQVRSREMFRRWRDSIDIEDMSDHSLYPPPKEKRSWHESLRPVLRSKVGKRTSILTIAFTVGVAVFQTLKQLGVIDSILKGDW